MKTLAERLIWAREQKSLTQDGLAKLAGVSQGTIGNLESGIRQTARKIVSIATAVGVDPVWLSEGRGPQKPMLKGLDGTQRAARMILAFDDEETLLDLYRRSDQRGRRLIMELAQSEGGAAAADQGKA